MAGLLGRLFVYGTLLVADSGATGRQQRGRLVREASALGPATTEGLLYNLGRYPGLVLPAPAGAIAHGEVLLLTDPALSLAWLDAYEGIVPGTHPHNEYERVVRSVQFDAGEVVAAWVYLYRGRLDGAVRIPGGSWLGR